MELDVRMEGSPPKRKASTPSAGSAALARRPPHRARAARSGNETKKAEVLQRRAHTELKRGNFGEAGRLLDEALASCKAVHGSRDLAVADLLAQRARQFADTGDLEEALRLDRKALSIRRERLGDKDALTAQSLRRVARGLFGLGRYAAAARIEADALARMQRLRGSSHPDLVPFLSGLASTWLQLHRHNDALACAGRALAITEAAHGPGSVKLIRPLEVLEDIHRLRGHFGEALDAARRALAIARRRARNDRLRLGRATLRLGVILAQIGQSEKARPLFLKSLQLLRRANRNRDRLADNEIATALTNVAAIHLDRNEIHLARPLCEEALGVRRRHLGEDHPEVARAMFNLGFIQEACGEEQAALELHEEALSRRRKALGGRHPDVARSLIEIARAQLAAGADAIAMVTIAQALTMLSAHHLPGVLARAYLVVAGVLYGSAPSAALFFAKLSINLVQGLREAVVRMDGDLDGAFVESREELYRSVGIALIDGGRLPEAQQVLKMIKEAELFGVTRGHLDPRVTRASLTPLEQRWSESHAGLQASLRRSLIRGGVQARGLRADQHLVAAASRLGGWFRELAADFNRVDSAGPEAAMVPADARQPLPPGVARVEYVLAADRVGIVLSTADMLQSFDVPAGEDELRRLVYGLRDAVQHPSRPFKRHAARLYDILVRPIAADLDRAGITSLALSLFGVLRYLPVAALFDGKRYLVERFALTVTTSGATRRRPAPPRAPYAAGLGVSRAVAGHSRLFGVREELAGIIRTADGAGGIVPGDIRLDDAFTPAALRAAVAPPHSIVHVSSHFVFKPAEEASSYLLLGDGSAATLRDLSELSFEGIDMMVLSACDTAVGGGHRQGGREIEGLGALVRSRGARTVVATLWPVADLSTTTLMRAFYHNRYGNGLDAAEALRRAQIAFLSHAGARSGAGVRRGVRDDAEPARRQSRFDHPYYWAPYIVMGDAEGVG
jgi:CHAT domain-containing protein/tetratricopeptide (TPR) repeat protein